MGQWEQVVITARILGQLPHWAGTNVTPPHFLTPWILTQASQKRGAILSSVSQGPSEPQPSCLCIVVVVESLVRNPRNRQRPTKPYLKGLAWR